MPGRYGPPRSKGNDQKIIFLIRNLLVKNWEDRRLSLPSECPKFRIKNSTKTRRVVWGRKAPSDPVPNGNNAPQDNEQDYASDDETPPAPVGHAWLRNNLPSDNNVPNSPKHQSYQKYEIPKHHIEFIPRRIAAATSEIYSAMIKLAKLNFAYTIREDNVPTCRVCNNNDATRVWRDALNKPMCAHCRTSTESIQHKKLCKVIPELPFCSHCGTHNTGGSQWYLDENNERLCCQCIKEKQRRLTNCSRTLYSPRKDVTCCEFVPKHSQTLINGLPFLVLNMQESLIPSPNATCPTSENGYPSLRVHKSRCLRPVEPLTPNRA